MAKLKFPAEKVKLADGTEIEVFRSNGSGKIPYVGDDGVERDGDFIDVLAKHKAGIDEREPLLARATKAETELETYKKLGPVDDLGKAVETVAKLGRGELLTVEKVGEIEKRAAEKRDTEWQTQLAKHQQDNAKLQAQIEDNELLGIMNTVASAKRPLANKTEAPIFQVPGDGLFGLLRNNARKVDGKWIFSKTAGEKWEEGVIRDEFRQPVTDPLVAVQELAKGKDWLFHKVTGAGSGHGNEGGGGGGDASSDNPAHLIATGLGIQAA